MPASHATPISQREERRTSIPTRYPSQRARVLAILRRWEATLSLGAQTAAGRSVEGDLCGS